MYEDRVFIWIGGCRQSVGRMVVFAPPGSQWKFSEYEAVSEAKPPTNKPRD